MIRYEARLQGAQEVVKILGKLEPDFARDARAELRSIGQDVISKARMSIRPEPPSEASAMSGWTNKPAIRANRNRVRSGGFPPYNKAQIAAGMAVGPLFSRSSGSVDRRVITLKQNDAAGMIYERAGSMKYLRKPTGRRFAENIQQTTQPQYKQLRLLGRVANNSMGRNRAKILEIIESVRKDATESLDRLARTKAQGR